MEIVYECCCGLDIHKKRIVACLITPGARETTIEGDTYFSNRHERAFGSP